MGNTFCSFIFNYFSKKTTRLSKTTENRAKLIGITLGDSGVITSRNHERFMRAISSKNQHIGGDIANADGLLTTRTPRDVKYLHHWRFLKKLTNV